MTTARRPLRRAWTWLHKWLGLLSAVLMLVVGITGSILAYERELDIALNPALFTPATGSGRIDADMAFRVASGTDSVPVFSLTPPAPDWPVWTSYHRHVVDGAVVYWQSFIDPVTGEFLGRRNASATLMRTINNLHSNLLLRPWWGREMVGVLGVLLLVSTLSGLYLWWPRSGFWRATVEVHRKPRQRWLLDLHNVIGFWSAVVLVVVAFSGVYLIFPGLVRPAVQLVSETARPAPARVAPGDGPPAVTANAALDIARTARPNDRVATLSPPTPARNTWLVALHGPGGVPVRPGTLVFIDPWRGTVARIDAWEASSAGARFEAMQIALHSGMYFGALGRLLVFLSGITLSAITVTGVWLWLRKRAVRQATDRRRTLLVTGDPAE